VWWKKRLPAVGDEDKLQRRLHERRRARQSLLLDLGALVYELHRQGKRAPDLLQRKAAQLTVVDEEIRELEAELGLIASEPDEEPQHNPDPDPETEEVDALEPALHEEAHR
jgi:hypothetical protein